MTRVPYYSPELDRFSPEQKGDEIQNVLDLIKSDKVAEYAHSGLVTLAMIRPDVGPEANSENLGDLEAAALIEESVRGLGILAKFSFYFDKDAVDEFYEGPAKTDRMLPGEPLKDMSYPNRWEEFLDLMTSGPTTALILYGPNAISQWRSHLGHWDIVNQRDPSTIRGQLGIDNHNNLVHGSDEPEAVIRELDIIARCIERQRDENDE